VKAYKIIVTDQITQVVPIDNLNRPVFMQIEGNNTVYIGGADVTAAQGFPIVKDSAPLEGGLPSGDGLWAVCASGQTETIRIITINAD
jgi:hypothetical protein